MAGMLTTIATCINSILLPLLMSVMGKKAENLYGVDGLSS